MRGSPLIRFILLALALAATGAGLVRLTSQKPKATTGPPAGIEKSTVAGKRVPFHLLLSAPAAAVELDTGHLVHPSPGPSPLSGILELDPKNPRIALIVRWRNPPTTGEHRFAKLTLEAPGEETLTHVFDAAGDIDDQLELPYPAPEHD